MLFFTNNYINLFQAPYSYYYIIAVSLGNDLGY